jgi:glycosyltransferase involved in cell wall biosynthesis
MIELSVIIPTCNRPKILGKVLVSLEEQTCPKNKFEMIVVDDGSTLTNQKKIKEQTRRLRIKTRFLVQKHLGPAAARNKGIKAAQGKSVLIINDDTLATPDLIKKHLLFHQEHPQNNFGLLGYVTWHPDLGVTPFMFWLEHGGPYFSFHQIKGREAGWERLWTCNVSLKKKFLLENGLFDEDFPYAAWEDVELGYRLGKAGLRLFYEKKAIGYHYHPTSIESIRKKMVANGESVMIMREKVPSEILPPLGRWPRLALNLDRLVFSPPLFFLIEKLGFWAEARLNLNFIFELILLHYRIEGLRRWYQKAK